MVKISVIGVGMRSHAGVAAQMFKALADKGINILAITTSEIKISVLIDAAYAELAVRTLHYAVRSRQGLAGDAVRQTPSQAARRTGMTMAARCRRLGSVAGRNAATPLYAAERERQSSHADATRTRAAHAVDRAGAACHHAASARDHGRAPVTARRASTRSSSRSPA